jgi:large subunit ribosomal protein L33
MAENRIKITLACTQCESRNYNTTKNRQKHPERVEYKKYCVRCGKHTKHKETK